MNLRSPDMGRIDSRKEQKSVYKRCLSALNSRYNYRMPSSEKCKRIEARVASEASKMKFTDSKERERWIRKRIDRLYQEERMRLLRDPLADLKAQIKSMMDE